MQLTAEIKKEYETLFASCIINQDRKSTVDWYVNQIQRHKSRYEYVSSQTGVPWWIIACIHAMEASFNFGAHLHNGDSLTARTVQVPAGRPRTGTPPFTWEASAIDALAYDGAGSVLDWSLANALWFLECYNGLGYRNGAGQATTPAKRSPYLWSFTNHYQKGKYVADGKFSSSAVSDQAGCCAIIRGLIQRGLMADLQPKQDQPSIPSPTPPSAEGATWFEEFRLDNGERIIFAWDKAGKVVERLDQTRDVKKISDFYAKHSGAKTTLLAPNGKVMPVAPTYTQTNPPGFTRGAAVVLASQECDKDISWSGNGLAKKYTKKFEKVFGLGRFAWCAAFVTWCCEQAGLNIPVSAPGTNATFAFVPAWVVWAKRNECWIEGGSNVIPTYGDIVIFDWDGAERPSTDQDDHIGFVIKDNGDGTVSTAEGNVNDATAFKNRSKSVIQGYIRIPNGFRF